MGGKCIIRLWYPLNEGFLGGVVFFLCVPQRSSASLAVYIVCAFTAETRRTAEVRRGCGKLRHYCFYCFFLGRAGIVTVRFSLFRVTSNVNIALWLAAGDRNGRRETPWPLMD